MTLMASARWTRILSRSFLGSAILVLAVVLCKYHPYLSVNGSAIGHDWYYLHQTDAVQILQSTAQGNPLPFWSPWILGGTPLFAVPTKAFSYPPLLLGVLTLGPTLAMNLLLLMHVFVGSVGMLLLGRRLGLGTFAATMTAIFFALTKLPAIGYEATPFSFGYAITWWPFSLICILDLLEGRRSPRAGALLGVLLALQLHAGGEPALYWLGCFVAAFACPYLVRRWTVAQSRRALASVALAVLVFVGLSAMKLLPETLWMGSSGRAEPIGVDLAVDRMLEARHAQLGFESRLTTLAHLLFGLYRDSGRHVLGICLVLGVALGLRRRPCLALMAGTTVCFVLASGVVHEWAYEHLPGYDRMRRHTRFTYAVGWGAVLLSGFGVQAVLDRLPWLRSPGLRRALLPALVAVVMADTRSIPGLRYSGPHLRSAPARQALARPMFEAALKDPRWLRIHQYEYREQPTWIGLGIESTGGALGGPGSASPVYTELVQPNLAAFDLETTNRGVLDALNVRYIASNQRLDLEHLEPVFQPSDVPEELQPRLRGFGLRPIHLYERKTAISRAAVVDAPILVLGAERLRRDVIQRAMRLAEFDAAQHVFVESERDAEPTLEQARRFGAIVFAGRSPEDPALVRWHRSVGLGALSDWPPFGAVWSDGPLFEARGVDPVEDSRFRKRMNRIEVD